MANCVVIPSSEYINCSVMSNSLWPHGLGLWKSPWMGFSRQEYWSGLPFPSPGFCLFFNGHIIALKCCVNFFCPTVNHLYTRISLPFGPPFHSGLPPTPAPSILPLPVPLGDRKTVNWTPCAVEQLPTAGCFTHGGGVYAVLPSQLVWLPVPCVHMSILYFCSSVHDLHISSTVSFF